MESNRERIIDAIAYAFEEVYEQTVKVRDAHRLNSARANHLDTLGGFINSPRLDGETDTDYRLRLQELISIKTGAGTKDSIIEYLENYLLLESNEFQVIEISPGYIQIKLIEDLLSRESEIEAALSGAIAAGIYYEIVYEETYWADTDAEWDTDDRWR
jgi:hypothetical protein